MPDYAITLEHPGAPEVMQWRAIDVPPPAAGEARVRQYAVGVNFIDLYQRSGLYPIPLPGSLGSEGAGVVEAVGAGVTEVAVGDRVAYCSGPVGAYAQVRNVPAAVLVKLPDAIGFETAAAMMLKGLTAQYLLRQTFVVQPGQTILLHAAAGGVGQIAVQWARALGAAVIGTVGGEAKAAMARALGCDFVIDYRREDVAARVRDITQGQGVPVVYDGVGKDTFTASLDCLAPRGLMVSFGNASGAVPPVAPLELTARGSLYLTRPTLAHYIATRAALAAAVAELFAVVQSGAVKIAPPRAYALQDAARAHIDLQARQTTGSVVLRCE
ncbi:quinone oxidoreductase [Sinimarinibacterium sp. NLF-5-8]|uniref:quinone oxidoreductase family protein n=1 Tax=Sinimarinibacterium sp. NLF-5-8 TaxID=2698684 RepID=UPI00137C0E24|nr:quinone oxidoreductase [Sinimarinibacterium sp. NLF-5-8]QHS11242.1 quinone oxidoreductase [Sinimarinibacterium sp. NLF-5-8]